MDAKAGERAKVSGTYECQDCGDTFELEKGDQIPECPCGGNTFAVTESQKKKSA